MSELQLMLTVAEAGAELELVDGELVTSAGAAASATALHLPAAHPAWARGAQPVRRGGADRPPGRRARARAGSTA